MSTILSRSRSHAVTRNYADSRRMYYYRVTDDGHLQQKVGSDEWAPAFAGQGPASVNMTWMRPESGESRSVGRITHVAADSNRVFVMNDCGHMYWRCLQEDSASWVLLVFLVAQVIGYGDDTLSHASEQAWDLINGIPGFRDWLGADSSNGAPRELADKLVWSLFPEEMKRVEGFDYESLGLAVWAEKYREWVLDTHKPGNGWNPLSERTWKLKKDTWQLQEDIQVSHVGFLQGTDASESYEIVDIAVGNWHSTVITYYALTKSRSGKMRLFYLDEEALMHSWKEVPKQDQLQFCDDSVICASHSVVAASTRHPDSAGRKICWMRFDAHTNEQIPFWPLNWTETWMDLAIGPAMASDFPDGLPVSHPSDMGPWSELLALFPPLGVLDERNYPDWHQVDVPFKSLDELRIDVGFGTLPWPTPKPYVLGPLFSPTGLMQVATSAPWKAYILVCVISAVIDAVRGQGRSEVGFLGENPISPNTDYPVCCIVKGDGVFRGFAISRSEDAVTWVDIDVDSATADTWLCRSVEGFIDVLRSNTRDEERCVEDADSRRWQCTSWQCPWPVPEFLCDAAKGVCVAGSWVIELLCRIVAVVVSWIERVLVTVTRCTNPCREAKIRGTRFAGRKPAGGATTWEKAQTFMYALATAKEVPDDVVRQRLEACQSCAFIRRRRCGLCGCGVRTRFKVLNLATYEENLPMWGCKHPWRSKGHGWPTRDARAHAKDGGSTVRPNQSSNGHKK